MIDISTPKSIKAKTSYPLILTGAIKVTTIYKGEEF